MFFESLGNFLTGHGWQSDKDRKKEDERNKNKKTVTRQPVRQDSSSNQPQQRQSVTSLAMPEELMLPTKVQQTQTLRPNQGPLDGINPEDRKTALDLLARGKDPSKFIQAAKQQVNPGVTPLVVAEEVAKATGQVGRFLAGGAFDWAGDMGSRVVETVDRTAVEADRLGDRINPWMSDAQRQERMRADDERLRGYEGFRQSIGDISNAIAGTEISSKEDTDREAAAISSGQAGPGELFSAATKSFGFEGLAAIPKQLTSLATRQATKSVEKQLGRALDPTELDQIIKGTPPPQVVEQAAAIGNGISTPQTVAKAQADVSNLGRVVQQEQVAAQVADTQRQSLVDSVKGIFSGLPPMTGRVGERGSIQIPGGRKMADDLEPTADDLAKIEANSPIESLAPENVEVDFLRDDIKKLDDLARQREAAGASTKSLDPIYEQIDIKTAELERMLKPRKVTKAEQKAAVQNEKVAVAQQALEEASGAAPVKAPKKAAKELDYTTEVDYRKPADKVYDALTGRDKSYGVMTERERAAQINELETDFKARVDEDVQLKDHRLKGIKKKGDELQAEFESLRESPIKAKTVAEAKADKKALKKQNKKDIKEIDARMKAHAIEVGSYKPSLLEKATGKAGAPVKAVKEKVAPAPKEAAPAKKATAMEDGKLVNPERQFVAGKEGVEQLPTKPLTKREQVKAAKAEAVQKETMKTAVKEQVKVQKKVRKAVAKAEGKTADTIKAAPKLAKSASRTFTDDPDLARTVSALGAKRGEADFTETTVKAIRRVSKQSDEEVLANANKADFGLGEADKYQYLIHAAEGTIPRLSRMRKAAKTPEELKRVVTAFDNVVERITALSSESGTTTSATGYIYKNASPDLLHARTKQKFEKLGGEITDKEDTALLETQESVYTAQKNIDATKETHSALMEKLKKKGKVSDKEIADLKAEKARQESILENALAENERVAGEIYARNVKAGKIVDEQAGKNFGSAYEGWRKASMLSAPTGRARDVVSSGVAIADKTLVDTTEAVLGKVFGGKDKGIRRSAKIDPEAHVEGFKEGLKRLGEIARGERKGGIYVDAGPEALDRKYKGAKSELAPAPRKSNKVVRAINSASAWGTELFRGYRNNRMLQFADAEGRKLGYSGKQLDQYKKLYEVNPPKEVDDMVEQEFFLSSSMHNNPVYKFVDDIDTGARRWAANAPTARQRKVRNFAVREISLLTMPFKKYAAGSLHRMATDQNIFHNTYRMGEALIKGNRQDAITNAARLTVNTGKLTLATAAVLPFLSDTDGNGKSYSPPYLKIGEDYVPLASLGPVLSAPIGSAWANKKFFDNYAENKDLTRATADWGYSYGKLMLQSTGMDSLVAGDSPLVRFGTGLASGNQDEEGINAINRHGGRFLQDYLTQWIPSGARDFNSLVDVINEHFGTGNQNAPDTEVKDENGKKDYVGSGLMTVLASIPAVRQWMANENPGDKANPTPMTRFLGASREGDTSRKAMSDKQKDEQIEADKLATVSTRVNKLTANEKILGVLDDETKAIYEKSKDPKNELKASDYEKIEAAVKKGEEKFLLDSDYDTYLTAVGARRDKAAADPTTSKKDLANIDFDMNIAKALKETEVDYELYNMYSGSSKSGDDSGTKAGISQGELKKMLDIEETDYYNPQLAQQLLKLDKVLAERNLSDNSLNTKAMKYADTVTGGAAARKGKGGGSSPNVITNIGSISKKTLNPSNGTLQYRELASYSPTIPNLSRQTARTNFKKNITVKRGVAL